MSDRELVASIEEPVAPPLVVGDDLGELRRRFADLMDRVGRAVHLAGLDFDDCVLERWLCFRAGGRDEVNTSAVEFLSDAAAFRRGLSIVHNDAFHRDAELHVETQPLNAEIHVVALGVRAVHVPDFPPMRPK